MAAYGAVLSLVQLLHPDNFPARDRSTEIETLYTKALSLQSSFEGISPVQKKTDSNPHDLDNQVRDAIYTAQDKIESFVFTQLNQLSNEQTSASTFLQELQKIEAAIDPLVEEAEKITESSKTTKDSSEYTSQPAKERIAIRDIKPVGQEEDLEKMKEQVTGTQENELRVFPITGLPGIGKTTLANSLYKDPAIVKEFPLRAWVTVSQDYQVGEVFHKLWSSMTTSGQRGDDRAKTDKKVEDLPNKVRQQLFDKKYLLVVDDIWDTDAWDRIKLSFPDKNNGSRIVLTTRDTKVAEYAKFGDAPNSIHTMKPLNEDHSWTLLSRIAFQDKTWHSEALKEVAFQITKNCRGLPLSLTVIGGLLYKAPREDHEYWKGIEEDTNAAAKKGDDAYLDILELSYNHLPRALKGCFLYMGAFPEDSEIPASKLVTLWVAEGFLKPPPEPSKKSTLETVARGNLEQLIDRNLLHVRTTTSNKLMKDCGMHDSLRDLAVENCGTEKFFHSRKRYTQVLAEGTNTQRRISVHRNILMCFAEVRDSVKQIELARTLIYAGSHHHHPLPFCLTFNLLRVLDAYTVYFLEFPAVIATLIHLRYLSFTYNGKLPASLTNLQKLQILIARRYPKIIFLGTSFLPDGIWNMPQLRHLLFTESDLPVIPANNMMNTTPLFKNLQSLSNVSAVTCTEEVIKSMPNLKKLAMWAQKPGPVGLYLNHLQQLESFKFTVLNPNPKSQVEFHPKVYFPDTLIKLRLSGCSLPWDHMEVVGRLPNLQVLKLREVAIKGDNWILKQKMFRELKFLLLEYLDLKKWEADHTHFPKLRSLILRHCYELEKVPLKIKNIGPLELIELEDCSPDAVESAELIMAKVEESGNELPEVRIYSSWE